MRWVLVLILIAVPAGVLRALSTHASLTGQVTVIHTGTNFRYQSATKSAGEYHLTNLPPGNYRLEIEKPDFKKLGANPFREEG